MIITYRLCEKQETLSGGIRWNNKPKSDIIKKCWISLQYNIKADDTIILIQDNVSNSTIEWLVSTSRTKKIEIIDGSFKTKNIPDYVAVADIIDFYSKKYPDEILFQTGDDYLYLPNCLSVCSNIIKRDNWQGYVVPYDYPDRYILDTYKTCELYINNDCHWRTVNSSTGTQLALGRIYQRNIDSLKRDALTNSDAFTYKAFSEVRAVCPIPGLSTHLTMGCMTPFIDWEFYWNSINI